MENMLLIHELQYKIFKVTFLYTYIILKIGFLTCLAVFIVTFDRYWRFFQRLF